MGTNQYITKSGDTATNLTVYGNASHTNWTATSPSGWLNTNTTGGSVRIQNGNVMASDTLGAGMITGNGLTIVTLNIPITNANFQNDMGGWNTDGGAWTCSAPRTICVIAYKTLQPSTPLPILIGQTYSLDFYADVSYDNSGGDGFYITCGGQTSDYYSNSGTWVFTATATNNLQFHSDNLGGGGDYVTIGNLVLTKHSVIIADTASIGAGGVTSTGLGRFDGGLFMGSAPFDVYSFYALTNSALQRFGFYNSNPAGRTIAEYGMTTAAGGAFFDMRAHGVSYQETLFNTQLSNSCAMISQNALKYVIGNFNLGSLIFGTDNKKRMEITGDGNILASGTFTVTNGISTPSTNTAAWFRGNGGGLTNVQANSVTGGVTGTYSLLDGVTAKTFYYTNGILMKVTTP